MNRPVAVCFGESVIDVYGDERLVAGSPVHLAVHLARLGWRAVLVTRVGDDDDGRRIVAEAEARGVEVLAEVDPERPTGRVTVEVRAGEPAFTIHPAAWDAIEGSELPRRADALCYGSLIGRTPAGRRALRRALERVEAPRRLFDVNLRPPDVVPEVVLGCLSAATVCKASASELPELLRIAGVSGPPGLLALGPRWLAVSRGAEGAELHGAGGEYAQVGARRVEVVDTVGAGDAFSAGLLDGIHRGLEPAAVLRRAVAAAESVLGRRGGMPPPVRSGTG